MARHENYIERPDLPQPHNVAYPTSTMKPRWPRTLPPRPPFSTAAITFKLTRPRENKRVLLNYYEQFANSDFGVRAH